jgi:hypothetical protein
MASCANCTEDAIGMLNGTPLCGRHLREVHEEWILQDDAQQEQEARRLGIEIPPEVLRDREFGPAVWLLSTLYLASKQDLGATSTWSADRCIGTSYSRLPSPGRTTSA